MKIKLQDYSLISNEWIESEIERLIIKRDEYPESSTTHAFLDGMLGTFERMKNKQQLIPSEKLADRVYEDCTVIGTALSFKEQTLHKQIYLNSEIELL